MSTTLSPRKIEQGPGLDGPDIYILKIWILVITSGAVTYGFFLCLAIMTIYTMLRRGLRKNRARQVLFVVMLTMLIGCTAHLALYMAWQIVQLPSLAAEYVDMTMLVKRIAQAQIWIRRLIYFLSDGIVVWRAWVIWSNNRIVHAFLAVCILTTGVCSLVVAVFNYQTAFRGSHYDPLAENLLGTLPLIITNFASTALISGKLWYYRHNIKVHLTREKGNTKVEKILILLLESGALYLIFWILLMIGDFSRHYGPDFEFEWFQPNISALYPTAIIFMVSRQMVMSEEMLSTVDMTDETTDRHSMMIWFAPASSANAERTSNDRDEASVDPARLHSDMGKENV
ncbi:hypothetical protein FB45DRAFT_803930 [Roridomyces roridus]|uniref:Uncharacterized protein n=1 Tax=Roridomyces roridus TaxID=1738132 RepID=A0AAD7FAA2_9AGAR|nr:hypothetical protein FB45DRAFT_64601 [Roridomyces roridus]KAJ7611832.1 hypothetical protein FB45DRAFT_803930 [Roridomyces roridus]